MFGVSSITQFITEKANGSSMMEKGKYVLYLLSIIIVAGIVLISVDLFYPFLPVNPIGPSVVARSVKTFWPKDGENLIVTSKQSPTVLPNNYSMSLQFIIGDARSANVNGQYRHIVHRGSNPCGLTSGTAGITGTANPSDSGVGGLGSWIPSSTVVVIPTNNDSGITDIVSANTNVNESHGLPSIMNPGIFLDPYVNDLFVFIITQDASSTLLMESLVIEDLPLGIPLTIGVVCNGTTLEVYLNCRLYSTLLLSGTPYLPAAENQWFGKYCTNPMNGFIKNLQLWGESINSSDYMSMCKPPDSAHFNLGDLSIPGMSCPTV